MGPCLSNLYLNNDFIQHSGRIMATFSTPKMMERPFTLAQNPNVTSPLLSLKTSSFLPGTTSAKFSFKFRLLLRSSSISKSYKFYSLRACPAADYFWIALPVYHVHINLQYLTEK